MSTRALTPRAALAMAAVMNLAGAFLGQRGGEHRQQGLIATPEGSKGMGILFAALVGAIRPKPGHLVLRASVVLLARVVRGLVGAALAGGTKVLWSGVVDKVIIPMFLLPASSV